MIADATQPGNVNGKKRRGFPLVLRRSGIEVRIYHRLEKGRYDCFTVTHYERGRRELKPFAKLQSAKDHAHAVLDRLVRREPEELSISGMDRLAYMRAKTQLEPKGIPVDVAVSEYLHLHSMLNGKATPAEAVRFYLNRQDKAPQPKLVKEVVDELLETRKAQNTSPRHVKDLTSRLNRFAGSFQCVLGDLTSTDINKWLMGLKLAPRTINNFRAAVSNLLHFARQRNYIERESRIMEDVPEVVEAQKRVGIYSPADLRLMLENCPTDFLPFLVLAAFGGLRSSEISRMDWANVGDDEIEVPPATYRVKSTRMVKVHPTLKLWLNQLRKPQGPVIVHKNVPNKLHAVTLKAGVTPSPNALRHSFASYSLALTKNPDALACEMGNSRQMLNKHYRRLIGAKAADEWFNLTPESLNFAAPAPGQRG